MFTCIKQFVYINFESNTAYPTQAFTHWVQTMLGKREDAAHKRWKKKKKKRLIGPPKSLGALEKYTLFHTPLLVGLYSWTNSACYLSALVKPTSSNN